MNFEAARDNMVEQQVRAWDVLDSRVLDVLRGVPREDFVPSAYRRMAYADMPMPLAHDQCMMKPVVEGRMLQALGLLPGDEVLEIGTGSAYLTACLAQLCAQLTSLDIHEDFIEQANARLSSDAFDHVRLIHADALTGYVPDAPFDAILVGGAVTTVPESLLNWLETGGRLVAITGSSPAMEALLITRTKEREWVTESLFETDLPYLIGAEPKIDFAF